MANIPPPWTPAEDALILSIRKANPRATGNTIAAAILRQLKRERTAGACMKRWSQINDAAEVRRPWKPDEDVEVKRRFLAGEGPAAIGKAMRRSAGSIYARCQLLGLLGAGDKLERRLKSKAQAAKVRGERAPGTVVAGGFGFGPGAIKEPFSLPHRFNPNADHPTKILAELERHGECRCPRIDLPDPGPGNMDQQPYCAAPTRPGSQYCGFHSQFFKPASEVSLKARTDAQKMGDLKRRQNYIERRRVS